METLYGIRVKGTEGLFVEKITIDQSGVEVDRDELLYAIILDKESGYDLVKVIGDDEYEVVRLDVTVSRDTTYDVKPFDKSDDKDIRKITAR